MIPSTLLEYLDAHEVPYQWRRHSRAVTPQELAAVLQVSARRVGRTVAVCNERFRVLAVLEAADKVDLAGLGEELGLGPLRLASEREVAELFPGCELGAEPPFGGLCFLPVVVEQSLVHDHALIFRAGTYTEAIEMRYRDYAAMEEPLVASFAVGKTEGRARAPGPAPEWIRPH
jgi:Ala-tRNA(Pro) deacylase